jgi:TIR domain
MARVFVSHSNRDQEPAARMLAWLRARGFDQSFLDFDKHGGIAPGADWERTLYREIERAQAVILILTPGPPPMKWSDSKYGIATEEDCNGEEAQA